MSQVLECKQLHGQGRSIRSIAKELGVARNTVRDYLRGKRLPGEYTLKAVHGRADKPFAAARFESAIEARLSKHAPSERPCSSRFASVQ